MNILKEEDPDKDWFLYAGYGLEIEDCFMDDNFCLTYEAPWIPHDILRCYYDSQEAMQEGINSCELASLVIENKAKENK